MIRDTKPHNNPNDSTGFVSPAQDYMVEVLSLDSYVCEHRHSTFFGRIQKDVAEIKAFQKGDILIIDRAKKPKDQSLVVASVDGEFKVKRLKLQLGKALLSPIGAGVVIDITDDFETRFAGVITYVLKDARTLRTD